MSNNKQTSVDQLFDQLSSENLLGLFTHDQMRRAIEMLEKAKAMHKEEIEKAWLNGVDYRDSNGHASTYLEIGSGEQPNNYYNETYGGNNGNNNSN